MYMKQILEGMRYVHEVGVTHRDLKPENILLTEDGVIKICDFGSAKMLDDQGLNTPYIVSRYYRAPELILACSDYTNKIDIWAIGCIFAELITLRPLFPGKTEGSQIIEQIAVLGLPQEKDLYGMSDQMKPETVDLIFKIDNIPKKDFNKILPKEFAKRDIDQASSLLERLLKWNPNERVTCEEALKHEFFKH